MMNAKLSLKNEDKTLEFAKKLASCISFPSVLTFSGPIGAGKTTLIRAFIKALGVAGTIKSPTFSLVESYRLDAFMIHHFDLYRICDTEELEYIGYRDYFNDGSICLLEWPEHARDYLPLVDIAFKLSNNGMGRKLEMVAHTTKGQCAITMLVGE